MANDFGKPVTEIQRLSLEASPETGRISVRKAVVTF